MRTGSIEELGNNGENRAKGREWGGVGRGVPVWVG